MKTARCSGFWTAVLTPIFLTAAGSGAAWGGEKAAGASASWHFSTAEEEAAPPSGTFSILSSESSSESSDEEAEGDAGQSAAAPSPAPAGADGLSGRLAPADEAANEAVPAVELVGDIQPGPSERGVYDAYGNRVQSGRGEQAESTVIREVGSDAAQAAAASPAPEPSKGGRGPEVTAAAVSDACGKISERLEHRREWLRARRAEQFALGGAPNAELGIRDATWQWCEEHQDDAECHPPEVTVFFSTEELRGGQAPEEYDRNVILMKRELRECRRKSAGGLRKP